ncbi:MAG TPA: PstS family phosphate ABC transporter substrate-binding protein [Leptolyngbyaceae cyanobacterium M33_DOE_097]|uniref:Phosphate-binding protein n=1 Tax=Oscillatoriales cyanobacterium SpSt-418 TaxID=2282169 RepID=A0A7C3KGC1_9CYAN|nr:PstS family phosphate ABC transporter substrate-binding protein [Leptolyngbyaceae cyanobacterium M33_DOE_097]
MDLGSLKRLFISVTVLGLGACSVEETSTPDAASPPVTEPVVASTKVPPSGTIIIDGSSTVYPITNLAASEFRKTSEGEKVQIDVKFSGTSAGFRKFCAADSDISGASRPILVKEIEACNQAGVRFIELPVAFDALTLAVNPKNTWASSLSLADLKKIWEPAAQGKITTWKQVRADFPNVPLKLFGAGKDSGTFDYFNEVVSGDPKTSRTDYVSSEDDNELVAGIEKEPNALGYIPFAYYETNESRLKVIGIDNGKGAVLPTRETVENAKYQPFSRPLFIYVNAVSAQTKPEVKAFVEYYLKNAKQLATNVQYIPLPEEGYRLARNQFHRLEVGTVFEGVAQPEVTIQDLLRRQTVFQLTADQAQQTKQ